MSCSCQRCESLPSGRAGFDDGFDAFEGDGLDAWLDDGAAAFDAYDRGGSAFAHDDGASALDAYGDASGLALDGFEGEEWSADRADGAPAPRFRVTCPGLTAARRRQLRSAVALAVRVANEAARRLRARPVDAEARRLFAHFFGTSPEHRVPWATRTAGDLVAYRFELVARELAGGRIVHYTCVTGNVGECASAPGSSTIAVTMGPSAVTLCDGFWAPGRTVTNMAGTLLHEGMHAVMGDLFDHAVASGIAECRRDNARCFQAFALRLAGHGVSSDIRTRCRRSRAQCARLP
jgi:hypothetical protein